MVQSVSNDCSELMFDRRDIIKERAAPLRVGRGADVEIGRLSRRQGHILEFVRQYVSDHSYPPTVREIGDGVGISSTSVVDYNLRVLAKRGHLRRDPDISRGIEILDGDMERMAERISVPVLGQIAAGAPIEAIEGHAER